MRNTACNSTNVPTGAKLFNLSSLSAEKETMPELDLPEPDTRRLTRSPLELVVCQVRHDRRLVASEGSTALAIHEQLGDSGGQYPNIEPVTGLDLSIVMGPGAPGMQDNPTAGWRLSSTDGAWSVTLMPDNYSLETTAYTTWDEDFGPRLKALTQAVVEHVKPTLVQRIGLRYVDRISELGLTELSAWQEYLREELLGLVMHDKLGSGVRGYQHQVLLEMADGVMATVRHGPVELGGGAVDYQLDYDVYRQAGRAFDVQDVIETADRFSVYSLQLFQATVKPALLEALR